MSITVGQTVYFTSVYNSNERCGILQEQTTLGYKIDNVWYNKSEISIKNILLDSKNTPDNQQLLFG